MQWSRNVVYAPNAGVLMRRWHAEIRSNPTEKSHLCHVVISRSETSLAGIAISIWARVRLRFAHCLSSIPETIPSAESWTLSHPSWLRQCLFLSGSFRTSVNQSFLQYHFGIGIIWCFALPCAHQLPGNRVVHQKNRKHAEIYRTRNTSSTVSADQKKSL